MKSASAIPRLPPLNRNLSLSTGAMHQQGGFRDDKIDEMERMVVSYQEKLDTMASDYQEKVNILENKLADKEIEKPPFPLNGHHHNNGRKHAIFLPHNLLVNLVLLTFYLPQILVTLKPTMKMTLNPQDIQNHP